MSRSPMMSRRTISVLAAALAALAPLAPGASAQDSWLIRADTIYTASGNPIQGGSLLLSGGSIAAIGPGRGGDETFEAAAVTPGLVELSPRFGTGAFSVEQSSETPIEMDVVDALDLYAYRWERELRGGVTSVLVTPQDEAVLGGLCAVVKTGGGTTLEERLVKRGAVLRGSMGSQPSRGNQPPRGTPPITFYFRRPTTRMGVEWTFRKAFYDAVAGAGEEDARVAEQNEILRRCLRGELPLGVQAWATQDIRTAIYLKEEFDLPRMFVDAAAEAWREPDLLVRSGMSVVLPPYEFQGRTNDEAFYALDTAAKLHELGVEVALSGHGSRDPQFRLARQPGFAMRGGLPFDAALAAVTIVPARLAGVDDRVGSIEVGKDADLVLWSGTPFEPTSEVIGVFLNGELVVDRR